MAVLEAGQRVTTMLSVGRARRQFLHWHKVVLAEELRWKERACQLERK